MRIKNRFSRTPSLAPERARNEARVSGGEGVGGGILRALFVAGFAVLTAFAHAEIKMAVIIEGRQAGTATLSQRLTSTGGKIVDLGMVIQGGDRTVTVRSESIYDEKGAPVRKYQETVTGGKTHDRRVAIVTFDADGANVVLDDNGDRSTKHVSLVPTAPREDESEFWFIRDQPTVGQTVVSYRFNLDTLTWDLVNTVYKGMRPMKITGRRVPTFVTESEEGTAFLDKDGLPLRLELPVGAMERLWETL